MSSGNNHSSSFSVQSVKLQDKVNRNIPAWLRLKCNEKLVENPSSLFGIAIAKVLDGVKPDGYTQLEEIQTLRGQIPSVPINIVYKGDCPNLQCFQEEVRQSIHNEIPTPHYHQHTEKSSRYYLWNTNCRASRKCIEHVYQYNPETTILNDINTARQLKRSRQTRQFSCKRRLFE